MTPPRALWWPVAGGVAWAGLLLAFLSGGGYYAIGAVWDKAGGFRGDPTLDGLAFLKAREPGEYAAIRWLWRNAGTGDGLLEAVGDDYTAFGRVSSSTGLPTVLGWGGHEHQWRGSLESQAGRREEVAAIYQSRAPEEVKALLTRYDVTYVVVGPRERSRYGDPLLQGARELLNPVFSQDGVTVFQVRDVDG